MSFGEDKVNFEGIELEEIVFVLKDGKRISTKELSEANGFHIASNDKCLDKQKVRDAIEKVCPIHPNCDPYFRENLFKELGL